MKNLKSILLICGALIFALNSCSIKKRSYMKGYYVEWHKSKHRAGENNLANNKTHQQALKNHVNENLVIYTNNNIMEASADNKIKTILPASMFMDNECGDNIVLKNGNEIAAKITEITSDVIKYKRCDNFDGPIYSINKNEVFMVKYQNGTKEVFNTSTNANSNISSNNGGRQNANAANNTPRKKFNGFAVTAFVVSLVGLFLPVVAGMVVEAVALIFGGTALSQIAKHKDEYKGRGLAIAAIIIALVCLVILAVTLSLM